MNENQLDSPQQLYVALREHLRRADERDVDHARPSQLAHALQAPVRPTLETLVDALFNGDVVLYWELECPMCKAFSEITNVFLTPLHEATCASCGADFRVRADQETQVTFSPHPRVRELALPAGENKAYHDALHHRYPATTVQELMTVQKFRDWAQNEPLQGNAYLEVRKMTLWFSDLTGSTALYARNGDPFAYSLVREHFDLVGEAVRQAEGAIVKTIGDGIMAVFTEVGPGLQAALDANARLADFNAANNLEGERRLQLKIGIHSGPAITVTLNERLDYFGTTVNVASRVSNLAHGREIVLTQTAYAEPNVDKIAAAYPVACFESDIRGLDAKIAVCRLSLDPTTPSQSPKPAKRGLRDWLSAWRKK